MTKKLTSLSFDMVSGRGFGSMVIGSGFFSIAIIIGFAESAFFLVSSFFSPILMCTGPGELSQQTFILQPGVRAGSSFSVTAAIQVPRYRTLKRPKSLTPGYWSVTVLHCQTPGPQSDSTTDATTHCIYAVWVGEPD